MRLIDTHCHIHNREYFDDPDAVLTESRAAGVDRVITVGVEPEDWRAAIAFAESHPDVYALVGWHPNHAAEFDAGSLTELRTMLAHPRVVALGEIGLDFYRDHATPDQQYRALHVQLDLAAELGLPVVFHAREAYGALLNELELRPPLPYLFHCFGGNDAEADRALALGALLGVDGPLTYKRNDDLRGLIARIPLDRIVLETDSPFLSPEPRRRDVNRPANIPLIAGRLAEIRAVSLAEVADATTANAVRFFGLP